VKDEKREILGDYELVELIGDGAQGKVFKARRLKPSPGMPPFVAIKMLRLMGDDEEKVDKFFRQAEILRSLSHPNIVSYVDTFTWNAREWDESHCLVMEYLEGETLMDRIRSNPRGLPWPEVKHIFERCLEALIYARSESVVHRDIKPSNVFLDIEGGVKIIDFDIARHEESGQASTIGWKGTFDYMAPDFVLEQNFRGDEQSDVFSLGVCFYQSLSGSLPFPPLGEGAQIGYLNRWQEPDGVEVPCEQGIFRALVNATRFVRASIAPRREHRFKSFAEQLEHLRAIRCRSLEHRHKDKYELTSGLGRGAGSEVFRARRVRDGKALVIKEILTGAVSRDFIRGIKVLQKYPHPGIVRHLDFIAAAGRGGRKFFLVLEELPGMPDMLLSRRLRRGKPLPLREMLPLFCQYLSALSFLHEDPRPIVHADIRPSSLYAPLGRPERGKLLDPGVDGDAAGRMPPVESPSVLDYMAPEFARQRGGRGTPRSDLYALGLCLYEALAGEPAFPRLPRDPEEAWKSFLARAREETVVSFDQAVFERHPRLGEILGKALAFSAADRYAGAADMRRDLESVIRDLKAQDTEEAARETAWDDSGGPAADSLEAATMPPMVTVPTGPAAPAARRIDWSAVRRRDVRRRRFRHWIMTLILLAAAGGGGWFLATWRQQKEIARAETEARRAREIAASERARAEREAEEKAAAERAAAQRAAAEKAAEEAAARAAAEKAAVEEAAAAEKAAAEKAAAEKAAAEKAAAEKAAEEAAAAKAKEQKAAAEKAAAERAAAEKAAAAAAAAERAAAQRAAAERAAAKPRPETKKKTETPPPEPAPKPAEAFDEGEERLLAALAGDLVYTPPAKTQVDKDSAASLLGAARSVGNGLELPDLAMSRQATEAFIAKVADFWTEASAYQDKFGDKLREAAWDVVHRELTRQAAGLLRGGALMRTPGQKAQVRIKFLHVLVRIDRITGRPSACGEGDPLRDAVLMFFDSDVDRAALLEAWTSRDGVIESNLPWIGALLSRIRESETP